MNITADSSGSIVTDFAFKTPVDRKRQDMTETKLDRGVIVALRVLVGWTFLYAGAWQILQDYSAAAFLNHVVTFHDFFAHFAEPAVLPLYRFPG
jgi:hypothetical protein